AYMVQNPKRSLAREPKFTPTCCPPDGQRCWTCCGVVLVELQRGFDLPIRRGLCAYQPLSRRESLLRSLAHQCPQRHQGSDGNVLVIQQLFLRERQRFHNGSAFLPRLCVV